MPENPIYRQVYTIRSNEVTVEGRASLAAICNLMQETAGNHALELNVDISQLQSDNLTWVLHRLMVKIERYPSWRDVITIETWPSSSDGLRAFRDFKILDQNEEELGRSLSYWLLLNRTTRRPVRIPDSIKSLAPGNVKHLLPLTKKKIGTCDDYPENARYTVRLSDLDMNGHVNNVQYVEWITDSFYRNKIVVSIDIEFLAECGPGDIVSLMSRYMPDKKSIKTSNHRIIRESDEQLLSRAVLKYK